MGKRTKETIAFERCILAISNNFNTKDDAIKFYKNYQISEFNNRTCEEIVTTSPNEHINLIEYLERNYNV